jgi:aminoglycoside phosphotransferase (APT) family kinase protein
VYEAGIPSPEAGEILSVDGRRGLIYERLEGISMLQDMNARPWRLFKHARSLAELHIKIHQKSIAGLPSYKDRLAHDIRNSTNLHEELKNKALKRLASLSNGEKLCHGDFHPGNVLLTKRGPIVIDWMTASTGNPWTDVARTSLLLSIGAKGAGKQVSPILRTAIEIYQRAYLSRYCARNTGGAKELRPWIPVIAAARLNEDIQPEREALIKMVQEGLVD